MNQGRSHENEIERCALQVSRTEAPLEEGDLTHTGQCLCGGIRFTIDAAPLGARMCWCRDCQFIASGSATVNVLFPEEAVHYHGPMTTLRMTADSGNTVERGFCPTCGAQMYSRTVEPKGMPMRVRAGTLDNPDLIAPQAIIWTDSAPKWAKLDPDLLHFPAGPPPPLANRTT